MKYITATIVAYITYLLLTIGTGDLWLWSGPELVIGAVFVCLLRAFLV